MAHSYISAYIHYIFSLHYSQIQAVPNLRLLTISTYGFISRKTLSHHEGHEVHEGKRAIAGRMFFKKA